MSASRFLIACRLILAGVAVAAASSARAGDRGTILLGALIEPPAGYVALCDESPAICPPVQADVASDPLNATLQLHLGESALGAIAALPAVAAPVPAATDPVPKAVPFPSGKKMLALLRRVNRKVNVGVQQRRDIDTVGQDDVWQPSGIGRGAAGDCEDIALEKQLRLLDEGLRADQLALAVVYSRAAGLHTVLVARTDAGDFVLDNRRGTILPWQRTGYSWVAMQVAATRKWRAVL